MKKKSLLISVMRIIGGFLLTVIVLIAVFFAFINISLGQQALSTFLTNNLKREVKFSGAFYPQLAWPPNFHISKLYIANADQGRADKMANIGKMEIAINIKPLFNGNIEIARLALWDSALNLERYNSQEANWIFEKKVPADKDKKSMQMGAIEHLFLQNSEFTYLDVPQKTDLKFAAEANGDELKITGDGLYTGRAVNISGTLASLEAAQANQTFDIDSHIKVGHTTVDAAGKLQNILHAGEGNVALKIKGADAAELFPLLGVVLPPTPPYTVAGQLTFKDGIFNFNDFKGTLGDSDLHGNLTFDKTKKRPKLTAKFISSNLYFKDLGPLIGAAPNKKDAVSAEQKAQVIKEETSARIIPDAPLDISKLASMDADVEFSGQHVISPSLPLDNFYMKVLLDDLILKLTPIKFGTANGDVKANITINARNQPVQDDIEVDFRKLSLARLMESAKDKIGGNKTGEGYIGGTIKLKGSGKSMHEVLQSSNGVVGFGMNGGKVSELLVRLAGLDVSKSLGLILTGDQYIPIRCVVGSFDVKQGIMQSKAFVIDTAASNIHANGTVNLSTEAMNFVFDPHPKDPSLLSLRSPIHIEGYLRKPTLDLDREALAQKGVIAGGLALVAPVVAFLGFIDPALGEDSDCAALIHGVKTNVSKTGKTVPVPNNK